jgi:non-homologous end joining protein Ku
VTKREARPLCHGFLRHAAEADSPGAVRAIPADALKELLSKKQKGEKIERPREPARSNVVNLMDALRESIKAEGGSERRKLRRTEHRPATKRAGRSAARHKKAS